MNIIYFADGPWAHLAFDEILKHGFTIKLMVLRFETRDPILQKKAAENDIRCTWVEDVNSSLFLQSISALNADIGVSMSFNQIFKKELIEFFPFGLINCHAGRLPFYRGRNVLNWALINGEKKIGVTCHYVDKGVDTGDIIHQKTFPVTDSDDYGTVLQKAYTMCAEVLIESLRNIQSGKATRTPQNETGTYFIGREIGDEFIDWSWNSRRIFNFVRAITNPGPYAQTWYEEDENYYLVYIKKVKLVQNAVSYICSNGGIIGKSKSGNPLVKTGDTMLEVLDYEIEHPNKMKFVIGDRLGINSHLYYLQLKK